MNLRACFNGVIGAAAILITGLFVPMARAANPSLPRVTNVSTNAGTNEFWLTATNVTVTIGTNNHVQAMTYMDDPPGGGGTPPGLPSPLILANVGDVIICHFQNKLTGDTEGASIHWHGIELDNDSDGDGVTQDSVKPGQTYLYRFKVLRPGLFWYHSHMMPGNATFAGMYGPIIVANPGEQTLISNNILPAASNTFQLIMADINFDPASGFVGVGGASINSLVKLCELYALGETNNAGCKAAGPAATNIMVNGNFPTPNGTNANFTVPSGQTVRLQLFNEALIRDFYLTLRYPGGRTNGVDTNIYRIGGQGGLLDRARLEGGVQGGFNFVYKPGNIMLGSGMRADVLINLSGSNGDVVQLVGNPLPGIWAGTPEYPNNYPVAYFTITNTGTTNAPVTNNAPILAGTAGTNITLAGLPTNALLMPPCPNSGSNNPTITFQNGIPANNTNNAGGGPNIDGYAAFMLDGNMGNGSWTNVPHPPTARYAHVGDVLELTILNLTGGQGGPGQAAVHPYHLHGFSMQPLRIVDTSNNTVYTYPYNEFLDTIEVYPGNGIVFRVRLDDRPIYADSATGGPVTLQTADSATGGALGRWLMHCHIFLHSGIGMMSELDVVSTTNLTPLNINCPAPITTTATGPQGAPVTFTVTSSGGNPPVTITSVPASGSTFPIGTTTVTNTAVDQYQCSSICTFPVTVNQPNQPAGIWQPLQPPNLSTNGVSTLSTAGTGSETVADDFLCTNSGYLSDVHVWGAWLNDLIDTNATFELKFWMDVPAGNPPPSRPGWQAWGQLFPPGTYSNSLAGPSIHNELFYDPSGPNYGVDTLVYRYDFSIPTNTAFIAYASNYYWVSVTAYPATYPTNVANFFGWKSTSPPYHFHDDANWSDSLFGPDWTELIYPPPAFYAGLSMDMSFALNTGIPVLPPPITPGIAPVLTASMSSVTTASAGTGNAPNAGNITITWQGGGILQNASQVDGPWTNVNGGASPYVVPVNKPSSFYRVVLPGQ